MSDPICANCKRPRSKHARMGHGDIVADMFFQPALVCPTALFAEAVEHVHRALPHHPDARVERCECGVTRSLVAPNAWTDWYKP